MAKGKAVTSKDPRKRPIVTAFKAQVQGCVKVTNLRDVGNDMYNAHCLGRDPVQRGFKSLGDHTIKVEVLS